jgi:ABC-type transport system involved in cytochrome c biogenesis permease subunit
MNDLQHTPAPFSRNHGASHLGRFIAGVLAFLGMLAVFYNLIVDNMPKGEARVVEGYTPWSEETLRAAETLAVQDGGRIKPLSSLASFQMLGIHGARSMKVRASEDGDVYKLKPTEWLLDTLFRPQLAIHQPTFRIDNSEILHAIDLPVRGRRDRYSYEDLRPGLARLMEQARTYEAIESKKRETAQQQTIDLAYNVRNYEAMLRYFDFARFGVRLVGTGANGQPDQTASISTVMATTPQIREEIALSQQSGGQLHPNLQSLLEQVLDASNFAKYGLFLLPPSDGDLPAWQSAGDAIMGVMTSADAHPVITIEDIKALENMVAAASKGDETAFATTLEGLKKRFHERKASRGEESRVEMEAAHYRKNPFLNALVLFLIGTITAMLMWVLHQQRAGSILAMITFGATFVGAALCTVAIVQRCVIMQRAPIGNLYDTIIFIATTGVFLALIVEWFTRRRFALGLAPMLGVLLILLARRYELGDAKDHMDPLVAVLDSNFWLATHVTTITLGYSAGLLAAFISCGYVLLRGLRLVDDDRDLRRALTRGVYGCICLCLFLSLVGTVLGGIWANYSWGRFWGWDPKENGALMICLWTLAMLHARLGGFLKEWALHLASIFTACVIAFSWWHVNFLGVGLHNYGFTAGKNTIWAFYGVMLLFILFGAGAWFFSTVNQARPQFKPMPEGRPTEA